MISDQVASVANGGLRLIVSMPPRHGKSELLSRWLPIWFLSNWPKKRVGLASYAAEFAATWGRKTRDTVREHGASLGLQIRDDLNQVANWELTAGGGMMTAGVGGPFTGHGFELLIIDDPVKNREEANSSTMREHLWDWWRSTARTRLEPGGSIIVVMTRWHEDDLIGRLLREQPEVGPGDRWEVIRLPALAEPEDPLGREEGQGLWPARFDTEVLANIRISVGPAEWPGLYQQRPSAVEGNIFHLDWWIMADHIEPNGSVYQFWDTAFKTKQGNDYSACVTMTTTPNGYGVLDVYRARLEYPDLLKAMQTQAARFNPSMVYVEDAASGQSVIQHLHRDTRLPVKGIRPTKDKVLRANAVTGLVETGKVSLPKRASWLQEFLEEMTAFNNGIHDDQVDAFVGCLTEMALPKWLFSIPDTPAGGG